MEKVCNPSDFSKLVENTVYMNSCEVSLEKSSIVFEGTGNTIYFLGKTENDRINITGSYIRFRGNNNLIFINASKYELKFKIILGSCSTIYFGHNLYMATPVLIAANENTYVHFGNWNLIARDVCIRTSDMHLIYDINTAKRICHNKDVYIGDHVWIGQNVGVMKGTTIGSGSILGWDALASGDLSNVNSIYVGVPAVLKRNDITWRHRGTNSLTEKDIMNCKYENLDDDYFIYSQKQMDEAKEKWDRAIKNEFDVNKKMNFIINEIS